MSDPPTRSSFRIAVAEAREILVVVLLVAAVILLLGPPIRYLGIGLSSGFWPFGFWDDVFVMLSNVNAMTGALLLAAALGVATAPESEVVPRLRMAVTAAAVLVTVLGCVSIVNILAITTTSGGFFLRLGTVLALPGPAVLLASTAAWLSRRVVAG